MQWVVVACLLVLSSASQCKVSIVGGGVGGLHTAFRLINSSTYLAGEVCVFEASNRVGGRAYSVRGATPIPDSIDIGAHGYKPLQHRVMDAIVNQVLHLTTACRSRTQNKSTCYDLGDSYYFLRRKYLAKLKSIAGSTPYNVRKDEEVNDDDGPNPILEAVLNYPAILQNFDQLFSTNPSVKYPAMKNVMSQVRQYKVDGKYPTEYTLETLLKHSPEYWALYLDGDGEAISSVLNANVFEVIREAVYYAVPDGTPTSGGFVIVNSQGHEVGYQTIPEALASLLVTLGANVSYGKQLVGVYDAPGGQLLKFRDGSSVVSEKAILNIALEDLNKLSRDSVLFTQQSEELLSMLNTVCAVKAYFYYPTAWWAAYGDSSISTTEINRYFEFKDSNIRCNGTVCHGVTQVAFADGLDYCTTFWTGEDKELIIINNTDTDPVRSNFFKMLADSTKLAQKEALKSAASIVDPTVLVMGRWKGGWYHVRPNSKYLGGDVQRLLLKPVPGKELYLVNEAYSIDQGWAEGSLIAAEKVLNKYFNLTRPAWMGDDYWYDAIVLNDEI